MTTALKTTISTKLTIAFVGASLIGIFTIGLTAKAMITRNFDSLVAQHAQANFIEKISSYYQYYGSWEEAREGISFPDFIQQNRFTNGITEDGASSKAIKSRDLSIAFFVVDKDAKVILKLARNEVGEIINDSILKTATPLVIDNKEVGYVVYASKPELSIAEKVYLQSLNNSLFLAFLMAIFVSIPLGIYLANRLSMPIRELTEAAKLISSGDFTRIVKIRTNDELGELSESFNKMSVDLEDSRKKLTEYSEELFEISRRDELTGLFNRRAFNESIQQLYATAIRYEQNLSIAVIDIDYFKKVNDENSHRFGDLVLKRIASVLMENIRDVDIASRYGGEEFLIAYPYTSEENAMIISERLRESIASIRDWDKEHKNMQLTVSIGVSGARFGKSVEDMMSKADEKLYEAKNAGRNCIKG